MIRFGWEFLNVSTMENCLWQKWFLAQNKLERKVKSREQKEAEELRLFELKQQKKKERHKGH